MAQLGTKIDLANGTLSFDHIDVTGMILYCTEYGHPAVNLLDFANGSGHGDVWVALSVCEEALSVFAEEFMIAEYDSNPPVVDPELKLNSEDLLPLPIHGEDVAPSLTSNSRTSIRQ